MELIDVRHSHMRLDQKVAIITGSGHGIGQEIALRFAAEGARVVVADLDRESTTAVAAEINAVGQVARAF